MDIQERAKVKILEHKLDSIRQFVRSREIDDPIIRKMFSNIINIIERYEIVTSDWTPSEPLVNEVNDSVMETLIDEKEEQDV